MKVNADIRLEVLGTEVEDGVGVDALRLLPRGDHKLHDARFDVLRDRVEASEFAHRIERVVIPVHVGVDLRNDRRHVSENHRVQQGAENEHNNAERLLIRTSEWLEIRRVGKVKFS